MSYFFNPRLVFQEPPENFSPKVEVAACFIKVLEDVLFLKRQPHKLEGSTWGIPGGKIEKDESAIEAVIREVREETAIDISMLPLKYFGRVFIRYPTIDFIYHMFETDLKDFPKEVTIDNTAHSDYRWLALQEALELPLIPGEDECIYLSYGIKPNLKSPSNC